MTSVEEVSGSRNAAIFASLLLIAATIAALVVANSGFAPSYQAVLDTRISMLVGEVGLSKPLLLWINDGLMAVFFLLVGLEIKRELVEGELNTPAKALLPVIGAVGGFVLPALIFVAINQGQPANLRGWAIPAATDIAFAVGIMAMLGRAVPVSIKTFLLALAIIDDLMAIIVIAIFYTANLSGLALGLAGFGLLLLFLLNRYNVQDAGPYILVGLFTWFCVLKSGVHATLAGVAVGLAMPIADVDGRESLLNRAEHALHPWVNFAIVPIFAFANAGVPLAGLQIAQLLAPLPLGIAAGLFIGKQIGVFGAAYAAIKLGLASKPDGATWANLYAAAILAGIGFTMSLFIGSLAFSDVAEMNQVRLGVMAGSALSAVVAVIAFLLAARARAAR